MATPASAATGGPCGQGGSGSGSLGSSGSSGSATGSLDKALPWITGAPDGALPRLSGKTKAIEMVTGPGSPNDTIARFNVSGTDLGIMWDNGNAGGQHDVLMAFGDTVGDCDSPGDDWRSNVLFRSSDTNLADGMRIDSSPLDRPNHSRQVIKGFGIPGEYTVIPTAGISVGTTQYARFMSVKSWDSPGKWTTLYSAIAVSTDNGETWTADPTTVRANVAGIDIPGIAAVTPGNDNFQMSAFVDGKDGFVYEYGTPSGRNGGARLGRVAYAQILNLNAYQYWNGTGWGADIGQAKPVIEAPVSELQVQWNDYLHKYVAMYTDATNSIVIRQADRLEGPWSGTQTILSGLLVPSLYGGFMHPWSKGQYLEFVGTTWDRYNVIYFRTDLNGLQMKAADQADRPDPATTGEAKLLGVDRPSEATPILQAPQGQ
ncbi:DUF4185 domain-containing protein [Rhodococcus spelaei]|uniref:DUF4185 domain-containing protein n=1 Tax=Rhodococcus spelaei TaxID=2546320 RepID=A0A541BQ17_9NOCA|nr:DUF4185 domain-containing protein [Rhodococcus spelaei]TQF74368.1 DUF4185 domain-containing protein [Rhodococcus spelaei]